MLPLQTGDIGHIWRHFLVVTPGRRGFYWHRVGGTRGCFWTPCNAQDAPTTKNYPAPNVNSSRVEKSFPKLKKKKQKQLNIKTWSSTPPPKVSFTTYWVKDKKKNNVVMQASRFNCQFIGRKLRGSGTCFVALWGCVLKNLGFGEDWRVCDLPKHWRKSETSGSYPWMAMWALFVNGNIDV